MMKEDRSLRWRQYHCFNIIYTSICLDICSIYKRKVKTNNHKIISVVSTTVLFLNISNFNYLCLWTNEGTFSLYTSILFKCFTIYFYKFKIFETIKIMLEI